MGIVVPDPETLPKWIKKRGIEGPTSELCNNEVNFFFLRSYRPRSRGYWFLHFSAFRTWSKLFRRISLDWGEKPGWNLSSRYLLNVSHLLSLTLLYVIPIFFVGERYHITPRNVLDGEWAAHTHLKDQEGWTSQLFQKANWWNVCQNENVNLDWKLQGRRGPHCQSQICECLFHVSHTHSCFRRYCWPTFHCVSDVIWMTIINRASYCFCLKCQCLNLKAVLFFLFVGTRAKNSFIEGLRMINTNLFIVFCYNLSANWISRAVNCCSAKMSIPCQAVIAFLQCFESWPDVSNVLWNVVVSPVGGYVKYWFFVA